MNHYLINAVISKLEKKTRAKQMVVVDKDPNTGKNIYEMEREDIGWFVLLNNSNEWLFLGFDQPDLVVGQAVTVRIEPK